MPPIDDVGPVHPIRDQPTGNGIGSTPSLDRRSLIGGAMAGMVMSGYSPPAKAARSNNPFHILLDTWVTGLRTHQVHGLRSPGDNGGFLCPACALVHGRAGDAVYPLLAVARHSAGDDLVAAARAAFDWCEAHTSRADGSWINDPALSDWRGITVFRAVALAEALHHHGDLLDRPTRARWKDRLARAMAFLDGFMTFEVGNINYPVTTAYASAIAARVLESSALDARGRRFAHGALDYFTDQGLLFGEGHPQRAKTGKGCLPVDLGYNVEESLPALALYARLTGDAEVADAVHRSLDAHLMFMLPDGAWDNSWGSRNYKWTWWGSRTSDGCQSAYALFADRDPRFAEAARRNLALMARTTSGGLLAGGPDYGRAGYASCLHHSLTHAKALATVIDAGLAEAIARAPAAALPCDTPAGLRSWPEIDTHQVTVGDWCATVTGYDFDYLPDGGGHATGGALSLLHHKRLGPLIAAGMNAYKVVEPGNQQLPRDTAHRPNAPRIETVGERPLTSVADPSARLAARQADGAVIVEAAGILRHATGSAEARGAPAFAISYRVSAAEVTIRAHLTGTVPQGARLIVPIICGRDERIAASAREIAITKPGGVLRLTSSGQCEIDAARRCFNLVPGFQFAEIAIPFPPSGELVVSLSCA